jgi:tetratricopeptide (TPR) repeat protein
MVNRNRRNRKFVSGSGIALAAGIFVAACSSPAVVPPTSSGSTTVPVGSPNQLLNAGVVALKAGNIEGAKADFNAVIRTDESDKYLNNNIAYYDLGVIAQTQGKKSEAETDYKSAIVLDPNYPAAEYNLAIEETAADPQDAIALYRKVITTNPTDVNAIYNLGLLLYQTGQKTEGEALLTQALQMAPSLAKKVPGGVTP